MSSFWWLSSPTNRPVCFVSVFTLLLFSMCSFLTVETKESVYVGGNSHHVWFVRSVGFMQSSGLSPALTMSPCSQISAISLVSTVLSPNEMVVKTTASLRPTTFYHSGEQTWFLYRRGLLPVVKLLISKVSLPVNFTVRAHACVSHPCTIKADSSTAALVA